MRQFLHVVVWLNAFIIELSKPENAPKVFGGTRLGELTVLPQTIDLELTGRGRDRGRGKEK